MRTNYEYKKEAKALTKEHKGKLALIYFIYSVIASAVNSIGYRVYTDANGVVQTRTGIGSIITLLIAGPFAISFVLIAIKLFKGKEIEVKDLFEGFKDFVPSMVLGLLVNIFITLWTFLFIVPGIVMALAYSMVYYIHNDHKELKAMECIKKSKNMMKGYKTRFFGLCLSYLGEILLVIITLGIYSYWFMPRFNQATYLFYLDLKKENGEYDNVIDAEFVEENIETKNI